MKQRQCSHISGANGNTEEIYFPVQQTTTGYHTCNQRAEDTKYENTTLGTGYPVYNGY